MIKNLISNNYRRITSRILISVMRVVIQFKELSGLTREQPDITEWRRCGIVSQLNDILINICNYNNRIFNNKHIFLLLLDSNCFKSQQIKT